MNPRNFAKIIKQAEKQVPIQARAHDRLIQLRLSMDALLNGPLGAREKWLEIRKLARHGKRIAVRFKDREMRKCFGILFNTASTYLSLPGDHDQGEETYALT